MNPSPAIKTVLIVEDNDADARIVSRMLRRYEENQYELIHVPNAANAKLTLRVRDESDVRLLELGLPDSEGFSAFQFFHEEFPMLPVVVLTGIEDEDLGTEAVSRGAQDYLVKGELTSVLLRRSISLSSLWASRERCMKVLTASFHVLSNAGYPLPSILSAWVTSSHSSWSKFAYRAWAKLKNVF